MTGSLYEKHNYWVMVLYGLSAALYPEKNITDLSQKKKRWISTSLPSTAKTKEPLKKCSTITSKSMSWKRIEY